MKQMTDQHIHAFRRKVRALYRQHGRRYPFRETNDPYAITVSEIMLQQTQLSRVIQKYTDWLQTWPDWSRLSRATNQQVLKMWSGLGYNRRALYLTQIAYKVVHEYDGCLPDDPGLLRRFPGIGPYTAHAIAAFAFGKPVAAVDTNIRKLLMHEFALTNSTSLKEIQKLAERLLPRSGVREWHYALMDYSYHAMKPADRKRIPATTKQPRFEGSIRQIRGEIIRQLTTKKRVSMTTVAKVLACAPERVLKAARDLEKDGLARISGYFVWLK